MRSQTSKNLCNQVSLYALGILDGDELVSFKRHLEHGCATCERELNGFQFVVDQLACSAPIVQPPPSLRSKFFKRLHDETTDCIDQSSKARTIEPRTGFTFVSAADGQWKKILPGIQMKTLFVDKKQGRITALARMAPNTSYPAHRHLAPEEFYVLEGTCQFEEQLLQPGDYHRAEVGSIHNQTATKDGCLMLMIFSPNNEMLDHA